MTTSPGTVSWPARSAAAAASVCSGAGERGPLRPVDLIGLSLHIQQAEGFSAEPQGGVVRSHRDHGFRAAQDDAIAVAQQRLEERAIVALEVGKALGQGIGAVGEQEIESDRLGLRADSGLDCLSPDRSEHRAGVRRERGGGEALRVNGYDSYAFRFRRPRR